MRGVDADAPCKRTVTVTVKNGFTCDIRFQSFHTPKLGSWRVNLLVDQSHKHFVWISFINKDLSGTASHHSYSVNLLFYLLHLIISI